MSTGVPGSVDRYGRGERIQDLREGRQVHRASKRLRSLADRTEPSDDRPDLIVPLRMFNELGRLFRSMPRPVEQWWRSVLMGFAVTQEGEPVWIVPLPEEVIPHVRTWLAVGSLLLTPVASLTGETSYFYIEPMGIEPMTKED